MNAQEINEQVTARIIDALEGGTVPWNQPWSCSYEGNGLHTSAATGKPYRGINQFTLLMEAMTRGYDSRYWLTFKQAQKESFKQWCRREGASQDDPEALDAFQHDEGGYTGVRKGEQSALVVFFKRVKIKPTAEEVAAARAQGKTAKPKTIPLLKSFRVFNYAQTDLERPRKDGQREDTDAPEFTPHDAAQRVLDDSGAVIGHGGDRAFFSPALDRIQLPQPTDFHAPDLYYHTAFHELTHWTGHSSRLARIEPGSNFGSDPYAKEELVAELGAAILAGMTGIDNERQHEQEAAYIKSWIRRFKEDKKLIVQAGTQAQRAIDYLTGATFNDD